MKSFIRILAVIFLFCSFGAMSQDFSLSISYLKKENDINKSKRIESFSIIGRATLYSVVYSGYPNSKEMNESKSCDLQDNSFNQVIKSIYNDSINQNIHFYKKPYGVKESNSYSTISIVLVLEGSTYTILFEADSNNIMDGKNYNNVMDFLSSLRKIIKEC